MKIQSIILAITLLTLVTAQKTTINLPLNFTVRRGQCDRIPITVPGQPGGLTLSQVPNNSSAIVGIADPNRYFIESTQ